MRGSAVLELLADVLIQDALDGADGDEVLQGAVNGVSEGSVVLGDGGGNFFHEQQSRSRHD